MTEFSPFRRFLSLMLLGVGILPQAHAGRVILISVDGLRPDALEVLGAAGAPNFHRLRQEGAYTANARSDTDHTVTLPNHTGMITGRRVEGPEGHHWIINGDPFPGVTLHRNRSSYLASLFDVAHDHGLRTGLFAGKTKFSIYETSYNARNGAADTTGPDNGPGKLDVFLVNQDTGELVSAFLAADRADPFDLVMLHLRDPDTAGHAENWDLTPGSLYLRAVQRVDGLLGRILGAIDRTNTWIVLTADHGGTLGTIRHDQRELAANFTIPFLVWGPGVPAGTDLYVLNPQSRRNPGEEQPGYDAPVPPVRNADAANLVLDLLGLPAVPGSHVNARQDLKVGAGK